MIELSAAAASAVANSHLVDLRVQSVYDGAPVGEAVPVNWAAEEADRSLRVPERVVLRVPREYGGTDWTPTEPDHPLAANGQLLRVEIGIEVGAGEPEWITRGTYLITNSEPDGDEVLVEAAGLLALIDEARLVAPFQPTGTIAATLRDLLEPALTVELDVALVDRAVPATVNFDDDRLGAVLQVLDAWPADGRVTPEGTFGVGPATDPTGPVLTITDQAGGAVVRLVGESTRVGVRNAVVARGTAADGTQVQGVAYDRDGASPARYGGPFNPLPVPEFFASPLLTTATQAQAAAETVLRRIRARGGRKFAVEMVPNPALLVGDPVLAVTETYGSVLATIESLQLPYVADGGPGRLVLREVIP